MPVVVSNHQTITGSVSGRETIRRHRDGSDADHSRDQRYGNGNNHGRGLSNGHGRGHRDGRGERNGRGHGNGDTQILNSSS
jgi:hypothetical protein